MIEKLPPSRTAAPLPLLLTPGVRDAVLAQDSIGWNNFLFGLPAKQWSVVQARHLRQINSNEKPRKWMTGLLKKLYSIAHGQWLHLQQYYSS